MGKLQLPAEGQALKGRDTKMRVAPSHTVLGHPLEGPFPANLKTLVVGLVGFEGRFSTDYGPLMAGYAIASIPLLILFLVAMRSFIEGLSQGALKA